MRQAIDETDRRREIQERFNEERGIVPRGVRKAIDDPLVRMAEMDYSPVPEVAESAQSYGSAAELRKEIDRVDKQMREAADRLDFEKAAELRDKRRRLEDQELGLVG